MIVDSNLLVLVSALLFSTTIFAEDKKPQVAEEADRPKQPYNVTINNTQLYVHGHANLVLRLQDWRTKDGRRFKAVVQYVAAQSTEEESFELIALVDAKKREKVFFREQFHRENKRKLDTLFQLAFEVDNRLSKAKTLIRQEFSRRGAKAVGSPTAENVKFLEKKMTQREVSVLLGAKKTNHQSRTQRNTWSGQASHLASCRLSLRDTGRLR